MFKDGTQLGITHILINDELLEVPLGGFINHKDDPICVRIILEISHIYIYNLDINQGVQELTLKYTIYKI